MTKALISGKYLISGNFRVGLIFAKSATSMKSLKLHSAKNRHNDKSHLEP